MICDELSDSDKGVSKLKFSLSLEDYGITEAKQSSNGGISGSGTFTRKKNFYPMQIDVSLLLDHTPIGAFYTTLCSLSPWPPFPFSSLLGSMVENVDSWQFDVGKLRTGSWGQVAWQQFRSLWAVGGLG